MNSPVIPRPDDIYAALIALHEGRTELESLGLWARLCLLLVAEIGDDQRVMKLIAAAQAPPP